MPTGSGIDSKKAMKSPQERPSDSRDPIAADVTETAEGRSSEDRYRAPQVCRIVGITYRQLDYWARTNLLRPSLADAQGSGTQRLYSFGDIVQLKVVKRLLDAGMSLKRIRSAVAILQEQLASKQPLAELTLLSDGQTIFAAASADEVVDVFRRGQGVFGIAVGPVQDEVVGAIHDLFEGDSPVSALARAEAT